MTGWKSFAARWRIWAPLLLAGAIGALLIGRALERRALENRLLATFPYQIDQHPELVRFALAAGPAIYQAHCASCHGADMQGNTTLGAPALRDKKTWLYGDGSIAEIERTVLYGIRSGYGQTHAVTEMTAFGLTGQLNSDEIEDLVQYLLELNGRPYLQENADAGQNLFFGKASCFDCHGQDGRGDPNYGAPNLTVNVWNNGGSPAQLYRSIYDGVHHMCPGWIHKLSLGQIRILAVMIHALSKPASI